VLEKTNSYILHYHVEEAQFSGTTALIVLITSQKIYTFNIGNSRVVLGKYFRKVERVEPFQVSHDHTIARFDERARILKSGGVINPYRSEKGEQVGPERIWVKNESYPGMFLTRTLGLSCAYKIGVISQPEVSVIDYQSCFKYLLLASDGFWTVEENDEAVKFF
jgi:serine/threonine protein phosphatase PrpC